MGYGSIFYRQSGRQSAGMQATCIQTGGWQLGGLSAGKQATCIQTGGWQLGGLSAGKQEARQAWRKAGMVSKNQIP
jgi:hypothetical protein